MGTRHRRRRSDWRRRRRLRPLFLIGGVVVLAAVAALVIVPTLGGHAVASGTIVADHTSHEFGTVPINGGLIDAKFAVTTDQVSVIKRLEST